MKVKKDYSETGGDSFDLVPIAVWHGQGRKAGWWSPILLAVYEPETDSYSAVCKCISGFTDRRWPAVDFYLSDRPLEFYKDLNERYPKDSETCSKMPFVDCDTGLRPDWYLKPNEVWEMRGADITLS
jgi:DNA ligase-1